MAAGGEEKFDSNKNTAGQPARPPIRLEIAVRRDSAKVPARNAAVLPNDEKKSLK